MEVDNNFFIILIADPDHQFVLKCHYFSEPLSISAWTQIAESGSGYGSELLSEIQAFVMYCIFHVVRRSF